MFQIHLWTGIAVGLYIVLVSVSGSIVIFRNELYTKFTVQPLIVSGQGQLLTDDELKIGRAHV